MKYSLRFKLTAIMIAIVSCVLLFTWILNVLFAEQYYKMSEKKNVVQVYHRIEDLLGESAQSGQPADDEDDENESEPEKSDETGSGDRDQKTDRSGKAATKNKLKKTGTILISDEEIQDKDNIVLDKAGEYEIADQIIEMCNEGNIRVMVTEPDEIFLGQRVLYTNMIANSARYNELLWYLEQIQARFIFQSGINDSFSGKYFDQFSLFDSNNDSWSSIVNNGYVVRMVENKRSGNRGLYLFGYTNSKKLVALNVPLESIRTSVAVSSRFLAYIGLFGILIGSIAILIVSNRFTKPIKDMAGIADQMAQLDFDAKVDVNTKDELEILGNSMNTLSETLESTIADLKSANLELTKDIEKKEQIDEMRKEFLSHVSHELKTPIALIQGYAEGLSENIMDDEESKEFYCEVIADEARKMNLMVQKLLTLNQIEFGNNQLELQRFDICQLIRNKIQSSQILVMKNQNKVEFTEQGPVYVWADEFMIEEVFSNYFSNALHHVNPGGLIRVWLESGQDNIRVHVYNEGKQISQEDLDKLWIKFYKVDKARTREYGGSGIGLSIVAATMKAHGKDYGVNNVDQGVDFYFDLDAA